MRVVAHGSCSLDVCRRRDWAARVYLVPQHAAMVWDGQALSSCCRIPSLAFLKHNCRGLWGQEGSGSVCAGPHWGFKKSLLLISGLCGGWLISSVPKLQWKLPRLPAHPPSHVPLPFLSRLIGGTGQKHVWGYWRGGEGEAPQWRLLGAVHDPRLVTDHGARWLRSGRRGEPVAFLPGQPRAGSPSLGSAEHSICAHLALVQRGSARAWAGDSVGPPWTWRLVWLVLGGLKASIGFLKQEASGGAR